ncbi:MAG TPA: hypothetical protein VGL06_27490, partial [Pseudonocardiaceae bacterium]
MPPARPAATSPSAQADPSSERREVAIRLSCGPLPRSPAGIWIRSALLPSLPRTHGPTAPNSPADRTRQPTELADRAGSPGSPTRPARPQDHRARAVGEDHRGGAVVRVDDRG